MLPRGLAFLFSAFAWANAAITLDDVQNTLQAVAFCKNATASGPVWLPNVHTASACVCTSCSWVVKSGFSTEAAFTSSVTTFRNSLASDATALHFVKVSASINVTREAAARWAVAAGVGDLQYLRGMHGREFFLTFASKTVGQAIASAAWAEDAIPLPPALKEAPSLTVAVEGASATARLNVNIALSPGAMATRGAVTSLASKWQSALTTNSLTGSMAAASRSLVALKGLKKTDAATGAGIVTSQPEAMWLEPMEQFSTNNAEAVEITQSGIEGTATPVWDAGLHGEGEVVGVADSGLDTDSCYFFDAAHPVSAARGQTYANAAHRKVVQYVAFADGTEGEVGGHGTHVAGSVAGLSPGGTDNGAAYAARLAFFDIGVSGGQFLSVPDSLDEDMFPRAFSAGARIHTNSWGSNTPAYTVSARDVDAFSWANQDFLVLFAAGNSGQEGRYSIGSPATAKNCVAVGASQSRATSFGGNCPTAGPCSASVASFSSIGPTADERTGVDVLAPGFFVTSAQSQASPTGPHCGTTRLAGTSMATPIVAGNAALVRQYFREGWYPTGRKTAGRGFSPMGALLKAVLVNSGSKMTGTWAGNDLSALARPNIVEGYGLVTLNNALPFAAQAPAAGGGAPLSLLALGDVADMPQVDAGDTRTFTIPARTGRPLKITIAWHDPPAVPMSRLALVNNLDLVVTTPDGTVLLGNGGATPDARNNVEQVLVETPAEGDYTVTVTGTVVPQGPQPFALVVTGNFAKTPQLYQQVAPTLDGSAVFIDPSLALLLLPGTGFASGAAEQRVVVRCGSPTGPLAAASVVNAQPTMLLVRLPTPCAQGAAVFAGAALSQDFEPGALVRIGTTAANVEDAATGRAAMEDRCALVTGEAMCRDAAPLCGWTSGSCGRAGASSGPSVETVLGVVGGVLGAVVCVVVSLYFCHVNGVAHIPCCCCVARAKRPVSRGGGGGVGMVRRDSLRHRTVSANLQPGWVPVQDASGKTYYWHQATDETRWEAPLAATPRAPPPVPPRRPPPQLPSLPPGWEELTVEGTGEKYYHNLKTEETQWERPTAPALPARPSAMI